MVDKGLRFFLLVVCVFGQECPVGKYGEHCQLNCSSYCYPHSGQDVHCDRHSGRCSEGCIVGWYGGQCLLSCSTNCPGLTCSQQTGHCTQVCDGNNKGDFCETQGENLKSPETNSTLLVAILVPVAILIVIIITVTVLFIRHRRSNRPANDPESIEQLNPSREDSALHVACRHGQPKKVRAILDQSKEDINKKGSDGMTPVMWAARRGHREVLDVLLENGANLSMKDENGRNILYWACYGSHLSMVKYVLFLNTVDINSKYQDGRTIVMWAARQGNKKLFELLVSEGDFPSQVDNDGNNILLLACWGGNVEIVNYVISHDAVDINGKGQCERTPLMAAAYKGHAKVFDLLVNKGADLTLRDDAGDNIFHVACLGGHVDIVSSILKLDKVDINSRGQISRTPLMMAAWLGQKDMFDLLVNKRADVSPVDDEGNNILHLACEKGHLEIVKCILTNKMVDINARNNLNETATMLAPKGSEVCHLLVLDGGLKQ